MYLVIVVYYAIRISGTHAGYSVCLFQFETRQCRLILQDIMWKFTSLRIYQFIFRKKKKKTYFNFIHNDNYYLKNSKNRNWNSHEIDTDQKIKSQEKKKKKAFWIFQSFEFQILHKVSASSFDVNPKIKFHL